MRIRLCSILTLIAMLWLTPAWAQSQPADGELRAKVAALYADDIIMFNGVKVKDMIMTKEDLDPLWLELIQERSQKPDALFFFLADIPITVYGMDSRWWEELGTHLDKINLQTEPMQTISLKVGPYGIAGVGIDLRYAVQTADDGSVWCIVTHNEFSADAEYENISVQRFHLGQFHDITPQVLPEKAFFIDGLPEYPTDPYIEYCFIGSRYYIWQAGLGKNDLYTAFEIMNTTPPYTLKAVLKQAKYYYHPFYLCKPQCYFEYAWNDEKYVQTDRICLEENWGIFVPELDLTKYDYEIIEKNDDLTTDKPTSAKE